MKPVSFLSLLSVSALSFPLASIAQAVSAAPVGAVAAPSVLAFLVVGACLWLALLGVLVASVVGELASFQLL